MTSSEKEPIQQDALASRALHRKHALFQTSEHTHSRFYQLVFGGMATLTIWTAFTAYSNFKSCHKNNKSIHAAIPLRDVPMLDVIRGSPTHHIRSAFQADNSSLCDTQTCIDYANIIKANLAPGYAAMDPCENFDEYVCGGWKANHDYRPDQASVSSRSIMADNARNVLWEILEGPYIDNTTLSSTNKTLRKGNFDKLKEAYTSCMDEDVIKKAGITELRTLVVDEFESHFPAAASNSSKEELTNVLVWMNQNGVPAILQALPSVDNKDPNNPQIRLDIGRRILPSKEYYNNPSVLANYTRTISRMFLALGMDRKDNRSNTLDEMANRIVDLDVKLSKITAEPAKARDVDYYYNRVKPSTVDALIPQISTTALIKAQAPADYLTDTTEILLMQPEYFANLSSILTQTPRDVLRSYLQWQIVEATSSHLHIDFKKPINVFRNQLAGLSEETVPERRRFCLQEVDENLGWALSAFYVERVLSEQARKFGDKIMEDVKNTFAERLTTLGWMSEGVKRRAAKKVTNIIPMTGYPTETPAILDPGSINAYYAKLSLSSNYFANSLSYAKFEHARRWMQFLSPTHNRWPASMTSPTVNAAFNSVHNRIYIPAAMMQIPAFSPSLPSYVSYGGYGATAGHELTHGFDPSGSKYDENGVYRTWWDNSTVSSFKSRAQCFVDQYNGYTIPDVNGSSLHINGKLTLTENVADAGGLASSFAAWQKRDRQSPDQRLPGLEFSKEQLFYISYTTFRCGKMRTASRVKQVLSNVHSPDGVRERGALANSRGFREAFGCKVREPTCEVW